MKTPKIFLEKCFKFLSRNGNDVFIVTLLLNLFESDRAMKK